MKEIARALGAPSMKSGLSDDLSTGVMVLLPDGRARLVNGKALELAGISSCDAPSCPVDGADFDFIHPDGHVLSRGEMPGCFLSEEGEVVSGFLLGLARRGASMVYWVVASSYPVFDEKGVLSRVVITFVDVTDFKRGEELMRSQRDLALILSHAVAEVEVLDACIEALAYLPDVDGYSVFLKKSGNLVLMRNSGLPEWISQAAVAAMDNADCETFPAMPALEPFIELPLSGGAEAGRASEESKGARTFTTAAIAPICRDEGVLGMICVASRSLSGFGEDIRNTLQAMVGATGCALARVRAEDKVRRREKTQREIFESIADPMMTMDRDYRVLALNDAMADLCGKPRDELMGEVLDYLDIEERSLRRRQFINEVFRTGRTKTITDSYRSRGYDVRLYPLFGMDNEVEAVTIHCRDVTEARKMEAELVRARERLEERVRQRTRALEASSERFRELAMFQREMVEAERARISREIHDELGQNLTVLKIGLSALEAGNLSPEEQSERITAMKELIDETVGSVREISERLRPARLDELGLAATMRWHCGEFSGRTGIGMELDIEDEPLLSRAAATALYRVLQESLTNAVRHADPSRIRVSLSKNEHEITLTVEDDGCGISTRDIRDPNSFGIVGMRERILYVGGRLSISGSAGCGTSILARVPLKRTSRKGDEIIPGSSV